MFQNKTKQKTNKKQRAKWKNLCTNLISFSLLYLVPVVISLEKEC